MSDFASSPIGKLDAAGLLLSPIAKGPTKKAGHFGFRGELALKFPPSTAGEKRPPEIKCDQVFTVCDEEHMLFFAANVLSVAHLENLVEVVGPYLTPKGRYFLWAGNVDLLKKYQTEIGGVTFYIMPLDEGTVYNEALDILDLEKGELKRASMEEKLDLMQEASEGFSDSYPAASFEQVVAEMGAVKVVENRPV